jgi:methionine aminopeptidase type II
MNVRAETKYLSAEPLKSGIGFPIGIGINNCVAHHTLNSNSTDYILTFNDIIKIDFGVHFNGMIIDSAFTIGLDPKYNQFIQISKDVTNFAIKQCGVDAILGEVGASIEEYVNSIDDIIIDGVNKKLGVMRDLSGHMIKPFHIHAGKAVPNIAINYPVRMKENEFYAIEPFITTGKGASILKTPSSHFMINAGLKGLPKLNNYDKYVYDLIIENFSTMPFCENWLTKLIEKDEKNYNRFDKNNINLFNIIDNLEKKHIINSYPPIYDIDGSIVAQHEHTIFIRENAGILVLTKNDNY